MANTFSQIYLQFVFAVKNRQSLIQKENKEELHKYITGLVQHRKSKMLAVHCMPDHAHVFVGFKPIMEISDFVKENYPTIKTIIVTNNASSNYKLLCESMGADYFIDKSAEFEKIPFIINSINA